MNRNRISLVAALVLLAIGTPMMGQSGVLMMSISDSLYYIDLKTTEYRKINVELDQPGELPPGGSDTSGAISGATKFELARWLWLRDSTVYVPVITRKANAAYRERMVYAVNKAQIVSGTVTLGEPLYPAPSGFFPVQYRGYALVPFRSSGDSAMDCLLTRGADVVDTIYRVKERKRVDDKDVVPEYSWLILDTNLLNNRIERYRAQRSEPKPSRQINDTVVIYDRGAKALIVEENEIAIDTIYIPLQQLMVVENGHNRIRARVCVSNVYNRHVAVTLRIFEIDPKASSDNRNESTQEYGYLVVVDLTNPSCFRVYSTYLSANSRIILMP
ncbi:MAG: hypothetical protein FGM32_10970 [Candidatus Kapabacteria bacterium]|nr:hypothetical protein [Candidatus Kapabacteria bacterium]